MNDQQNMTFQERAVAYAETFLEVFTKTITQYYGAEANEIIEKGYPVSYLALYKKELGKDISISVFCSENDFFVFFTKPTGHKVRKLINMYGNPEFGSDWTHHTPGELKTAKVRELLDLNSSIIIGEEISIPGGHFIANDIGEMRRQAEGHGNSLGQQYGETAKHHLPFLREFIKTRDAKLTIRQRYKALVTNTSKDKHLQITSQQVGHEFERLIRETLNMYGWQAKKISLPGEGSDFTAIFEGHHILGETRWIKNPVTGEEVHAFANKLNPRPQTIGLMISYSGFDEGAYAVARRTISTRTIVFFTREHIEKIILTEIDPGNIFSLELRNVYDYLFENIKTVSKKRNKPSD